MPTAQEIISQALLDALDQGNKDAFFAQIQSILSSKNTRVFTKANLLKDSCFDILSSVITRVPHDKEKFKLLLTWLNEIDASSSERVKTAIASAKTTVFEKAQNHFPFTPLTAEAQKEHLENQIFYVKLAVSHPDCYRHLLKVTPSLIQNNSTIRSALNIITAKQKCTEGDAAGILNGALRTLIDHFNLDDTDETHTFEKNCTFLLTVALKSPERYELLECVITKLKDRVGISADLWKFILEKILDKISQNKTASETRYLIDVCQSVIKKQSSQLPSIEGTDDFFPIKQIAENPDLYFLWPDILDKYDTAELTITQRSYILTTLASSIANLHSEEATGRDALHKKNELLDTLKTQKEKFIASFTHIPENFSPIENYNYLCSLILSGHSLQYKELLFVLRTPLESHHTPEKQEKIFSAAFFQYKNSFEQFLTEEKNIQRLNNNLQNLILGLLSNKINLKKLEYILNGLEVEFKKFILLESADGIVEHDEEDPSYLFINFFTEKLLERSRIISGEDATSDKTKLADRMCQIESILNPVFSNEASRILFLKKAQLRTAINFLIQNETDTSKEKANLEKTNSILGSLFSSDRTLPAELQAIISAKISIWIHEETDETRKKARIEKIGRLLLSTENPNIWNLFKFQKVDETLSSSSDVYMTMGERLILIDYLNDYLESATPAIQSQATHFIAAHTEEKFAVKTARLEQGLSLLMQSRQNASDPESSFVADEGESLAPLAPEIPPVEIARYFEQAFPKDDAENSTIADLAVTPITAWLNETSSSPVTDRDSINKDIARQTRLEKIADMLLATNNKYVWDAFLFLPSSETPTVLPVYNREDRVHLIDYLEKSETKNSNKKSFIDEQDKVYGVKDFRTSTLDSVKLEGDKEKGIIESIGDALYAVFIKAPYDWIIKPTYDYILKPAANIISDWIITPIGTALSYLNPSSYFPVKQEDTGVPTPADSEQEKQRKSSIDTAVSDTEEIQAAASASVESPAIAVINDIFSEKKKSSTQISCPADLKTEIKTALSALKKHSTYRTSRYLTFDFGNDLLANALSCITGGTTSYDNLTLQPKSLFNKLKSNSGEFEALIANLKMLIQYIADKKTGHEYVKQELENFTSNWNKAVTEASEWTIHMLTKGQKEEKNRPTEDQKERIRLKANSVLVEGLIAHLIETLTPIPKQTTTQAQVSEALGAASTSTSAFPNREQTTARVRANTYVADQTATAIQPGVPDPKERTKSVATSKTSSGIGASRIWLNNSHIQQAPVQHSYTAGKVTPSLGGNNIE